MVEAHATLDSIVAAHAISIARARPASLRQLLFGRERRAARLMVLLAVCNQANGVSTLTVYLGTVLARQLGVEGKSAGLISCCLIFVKLVAVLIAMLAVDRVGRRTLLLFGSAFTAAALALSAAAVSAGSAPLAVAAIGLTVVFYAGSLAPVFYILLAELFSEGVRPLAAAVATGVTFATGAVADSVFLSLCGAVGYDGTLAVFAATCAACGAAVLYFLPETKGRSRLAVLRLLASDAAGFPATSVGVPSPGDDALHTELSTDLTSIDVPAEHTADESTWMTRRTSSALVLAA